MSRMGNASSFFQREDAQGLQVLGPLFLLCTLSFATKSQIAFDFLFLSLVGFYLSARFQLRGFVYALVLLGIGSAAKHFMVNDHLWQLGLQGSLATAFLITALSSEQSSFLTQSYIAQLETNAATLRNLEEEFSKNNEISLSLQIAAQERLAQLQKEFDELQSEHSSILILNEVLRRSNAKAMQESHSLQGSFLDQQRKVDLLRNELKQSQAELALLKNTEEVLRQNQELFEELNVAREELEQAQIFKESIAWKHEKEQNRALTAENELIEAKEQMEGFRLEIKTLQSLLQQMAPEVDQARKLNAEYNEVASQRNFLAEKLREYESEITNLKNRPLDPEMLQELHSSRAKIDALVSEKNALEEQYILASRKIADLQRRLADTVPAIEAEKTIELLAGLEREKDDLKSRLEASLQQIEQQNSHQISPQILEELHFCREKAARLSKIEALFKQLRKQFDEKNAVLHQVRSELFMTDTAFEAYKIEQEQSMLEHSFLPKTLQNDLEDLEIQVLRLEEENRSLEELVTHLSAFDESLSAKKKVKMKSLSKLIPVQELLF